MRRAGEMEQQRRQLKQWCGAMKGMVGKLTVAAFVLVFCTFSLFFFVVHNPIYH